MSNIQLRKWEIVWGDTTIPVTSDMVVEAMSKAVSTVNKEFSFNPIIKGDARMKMEWELAGLILELVKHQFSALFSMEMNAQVKMMIPKGKPS